MTSLRFRGDGGRLLHGVVAATAAAALLTACKEDPTVPQGDSPGPQPGECVAATDKPVSLVVGARMGSQRPNVAAEVKDLLSGAVARQQGVQVFRVDGEPSRAVKVSPVIDGKNEPQRKQQVATAVQQITAAVTDLGAKKPEADGLSALSQAAKLTDDGGTIVFMDSGLSTAGAVSFLNGGMFDADPGEVANFLAAKQLLPAMQNKTVLLVGVGLTAEPQPALDDNLQKRVTALWEAIAAKAGAKCSAVVQVPSRREAAKSDQPVSKVALPAPVVFRACGTTVLQDSGTVGFRPNSAELRDETAAQNTLRELVSQLTAGSQKVSLIGNTATFGPPQDSATLSKQRAETVKTLLVRAGIAAERVDTVGAGQTGKYHKPDIGSDGALDPVLAAQNRSVVVEMSCAG
ncbi:OmpA family protein [Amycolatopsis sp. QT-25]|uniref:OmpA family protein n=1 Tax=Amycolatopsis sp. QT-25 TaxID=3034022 RepID=UPI0023EDB4FA|nr:OmpA family protein [Amycolatopsis sp. QT-25]WET76205.1 OmpA family protein [Amycolatopsis sp. QT-25]